MDAEGRGDYAVAAEWWRRLSAIDPLKTRAVVGLMGALAESGDRAGALRHAERYAERMREDLDGEPSEAVTSYAQTLRGEAEQHAFADRFVIECELGRGGMAVVCLARDTKHDRQVALKMLHPELSAAVGRERLEQEILVTAGLQHPHILPLHDSGEWAGTLYYVMPFVDGESLRARLALLAAAERSAGRETSAITLFRESRSMRAAIGDVAGVAECDTDLARAGTSA